MLIHQFDLSSNKSIYNFDKIKRWNEYAAQKDLFEYLTLMLRTVFCARIFSDGYFSMKKGIWRYQIFWLFLIHFQNGVSENLEAPPYYLNRPFVGLSAIISIFVSNFIENLITNVTFFEKSITSMLSLAFSNSFLKGWVMDWTIEQGIIN